MSNDDVYIWFSSATDITGKNLQETLDISGGKTKPVNKKIIIGWGTKVDEDVTIPNDVFVLNHPNSIKLNRNKMESSKKLANALNINGVTKVAKIVTADRVKEEYINNGILTKPLIGRKKFHQGGKGFWECPTSAQLENAIKSGAQYFQEMIPVKDEYRLHVFGNEIIHAVKKTQRTDEEFETEWVEDEFNRQKDLWAKNNVGEFNENQAKAMLKRQAKSACAGGANMVLRSNKLGWKFKIVKTWNTALTELAIAAVKALNLDFGAVDCCIDVNNNPYIFEVNTGPGLEGTSFEKYVEAFKKAIKSYEKPKKVIEPKNTTVNKTKIPVSKDMSRKELLTQQLQRLTEMVQEATEDEVDIVQKLGARLIFGNND